MNNRFFFKEILLFSVVGLFINIFCVFLFFIPVHATSVSSATIPYVVPSWRNANSCIPEQALESATTRYLNDVRNYFGYQGDLSYLVFTTDGIVYNDRYQIFFVTNPSITNNYISDFDYTSGNITVYSNNIQLICVYVRMSDFVDVGDAINLGTQVNLCGSSSTTSLNGGNLTPRYPFFMVGSDILSSNGNIIFTNTVPYTPPEFTGHAVPPDSFDEPIFSTGHAKPSQVPQLTINNYTWSTPPSPDFSTLEDTAESIYNYLSWLGFNLLGAFGNLINNIGSVAEYLGKTLQYYLGLILSAIINGFTNFYNNMVALIEPFLNYFTEPVDTEAVQESVEDTSIYGLITVGWNFHNTYKDFFDDIVQLNTLTFSIPYTIWSQTGYIVIDFSWYDDIRDSVLPWIIGFLYAGFGLYIFRSIPSIIHGLSGVMQKGA